ncbi:peroxiredoxin family protein [Microbacteriaceae bacterium 4G12]
MMMMLRKLLVIGLLIALCGYALYHQFWKTDKVTVAKQKSAAEVMANAGLEIGKAAPDFELQALDGSKMKLSDLKGKKVILNFWATWCPPCKEEVPEMQAFYEKHKDNVVILAVNYTISEKAGAEEKVKNFAKENGVTFPILLDTTSNVGNMYKVISLPTSYFIDTNGVIRQKFIGPMTVKYMEKMVNQLK